MRPGGSSRSSPSTAVEIAEALRQARGLDGVASGRDRGSVSRHASSDYGDQLVDRLLRGHRHSANPLDDRPRQEVEEDRPDERLEREERVHRPDPAAGHLLGHVLGERRRGWR